MLVVQMLLAALFVCCILVEWWQQRRRRRYSGRGGPQPPVYPGALPIIGHAHLLLDKDKLFDLIQDITTFTREKQCDSITLSIGPLSAYVITDPDDCLTVSNACLKKSYIYNFLAGVAGSGILASNLEQWKRHRKVANLAFNPSILNEFIKIFNYKAKQLLSDIAPYIGKGPFIPDQVLAYFVLETTCCTTLNLKTDTVIDKSFIHLTEELCKVIWERFQKFWLHNETIYRWSSLRKKEDKLIESFKDYVTKPIHKRGSELFRHTDKNVQVEDNSGINKKPLLDLLLHLQQTKDDLTDLEIQQSLITILFASYDTSTKSLVYILLLIGSHKREQERIYEELQEVFGNTDRDVDKQDLNKLLYLEAVIKEALRLYPVGAQMSRSSDTEVKLKNSTIPAGSDIVILAYAVNRHPIWGPDADEFRPERWLEPGGVPDNPNAFATFSIGKRSCIGRQYVMMMMKITLAHFLRRYQVTGDIRKLKVQFDNIMMGPKSGQEICIESRV